MQVLCVVAFLLAISSQSFGVRVNASGTKYVEQFTTAIPFYIQLHNDGVLFSNVTIVPGNCCLIADPVDCEIMKVNPPVKLALIPQATAEAKFYFRNFYPRYRRGNCTFTIHVIGGQPQEFSHSIKFNTYPDPLYNESVMECNGVDQDADRNCTPVDCAIKYRGKRNFYRNSTGKCEKVVPCNTRGKDNKIIAYYDWEENACRSLNMDEDENSFTHIQSDTMIPENIDIENAMGAKEFHNFEPAKLEQDKLEPLECNHGKQVGIYCQCDEGWQSTGLHEVNGQFIYSWCNAPEDVPDNINAEPRILNPSEEITYSILITLAVIVAILLWILIIYEFIFWRTGRAKRMLKWVQAKLRSHKNKRYSLLQ